MVCMWYIISTLYSHSSCLELFRLWSLLWQCVDLRVDMNIPVEPTAFAFRVKGLGTSLSLMQAYMVSQPIRPYSEHLSFWSDHSAVSG
jgi:hypothetical protein